MPRTVRCQVFRMRAALGIVALMAAAAFLAGCGQSEERSAIESVMTPEFRERITYTESEDFVEPALPAGSAHTLDVEQFVDSLMPILANVELGSGPELGEDEAQAIDDWMQEYIIVADDHPSGYLLALMWAMVAPPIDFELLVWERELLENELTEWDRERFNDRYPAYLYELARIWLEHNADSKPAWLTIRD